MSTDIIRREPIANLVKRADLHRTVFEAWRNSVTPRTWKNYEEALFAFIGWLGDEPRGVDGTLARLAKTLTSWDSATAHATVLRYMQWMQTQKLAPNTINVRLSALRSFTKMARQLGAIPWMLEVKGVKAENIRDTRGPDLETVRGLLKRVDAAESLPSRLLLRLAFENGFRGVELRELRLGDVRLLDGPTPCVMVRGKGKSGLRPITLSAKAAELMEAYLPLRRIGCAKDADDPNSFVFSPYMKPLRQLTAQALHARISKLGKKYGLKLWPHGLRHSAITAVLDAVNGDVRKAQKFSRHARMETLMRYDDERRDVAGELTQMLSEKTK